MKISDLREVPPHSTLRADICIVGAGPAGLTLATELANTRHRILVLESGGGEGETPFAAALNHIESTGEPRVEPPSKVRNRGLGGSSLTWSGRCAPLDPIDFGPRAWIPFSSWPVSEAEMRPFLGRANAHIGLQPADYQAHALTRNSVVEGSNGELRSVLWQFSRSSRFNPDYVRFGARFRKLAARNIELLTHATLTELLPVSDGRAVEAALVSTPERAQVRIESRCFVLCAGGIENARILLHSRRGAPHGLGNDCDMVGRFLMDHPRATLGTFPVSAQGLIRKEFGLFRHPGTGARMQRGLAFTADHQRRTQTLNAAAWTTQHVAEDDVWRALRTAGFSNQGPGWAQAARIALRSADQILLGAWHKLKQGELPRRMGRLDLDAMVEQVPDPASRIQLSTRCDALGMPLASLHWRVGELERTTLIELAHAVNGALARAGKPEAVLADWVQHRRPDEAVFTDTAHPIGSTRMSDHPSTGAVDRHLRVHGIDNLYVAGSSVFPTAGHANPTLMIVAMSIRLADLLRDGG